jgi:hypothetical protein
MKKVCLAILFVGLLICSGMAAAEQPAKEPVDKLVLIHYKDKVNSKSPAATDQATLYKLLGVKWTKFPVSYVINPGSFGSTGEQEIQNAFNTWDSITAKNLFSYTGATTANAVSQDNKNIVFWGPISNNNIIAVTTIWYNRRTKEIVETDIEMNSNLQWGTPADSLVGKFDIQNIITHEAGHVCGLGDLYNSPASELTMYGYSATGETKKDTLGVGDILGLQKLYGK